MLQQVAELTGERSARYVGPHLLLLRKDGQDVLSRKRTEIIIITTKQIQIFLCD